MADLWNSLPLSILPQSYKVYWFDCIIQHNKHTRHNKLLPIALFSNKKHGFFKLKEEKSCLLVWDYTEFVKWIEKSISPGYAIFQKYAIGFQ